MSRLPLISILVAAALVPACSKKDSGSSASATKPAGDQPAAAPTKLPHLGLKLDVPGDEITVSNAIGGDGDMVQATTVGALQVEVWKTPQTLDEAKDDAKAFNPKNVTSEKLADGWALTYDNTGSTGANYFVTVRRDIAGKTYKCSTTVDAADPAKAALAACKTLR
jgi:hypothetical protein